MRRRMRGVSGGFTLLELMIVIIIIGVLGAVVTLNFVGQADQAKADATRTSMNAVVDALKLYSVRYNAYPPSQQLDLLVVNQYLEDVPLDSWGNQFAYYSPTEQHEWELISAGKDGQWNTQDDIILFPGVGQ